eukprot:7793818-Karenia_brevis.AAC.1
MGSVRGPSVGIRGVVLTAAIRVASNTLGGKWLITRMGPISHVRGGLSTSICTTCEVVRRLMWVVGLQGAREVLNNVVMYRGCKEVGRLDW